MKNNLFMMKTQLMEVQSFTGRNSQTVRNNRAHLKQTLHGTQKKQILPHSLHEVRIKMPDVTASITDCAGGPKE